MLQAICKLRMKAKPRAGKYNLDILTAKRLPCAWGRKERDTSRFLIFDLVDDELEASMEKAGKQVLSYPYKIMSSIVAPNGKPVMLRVSQFSISPGQIAKLQRGESLTVRKSQLREKRIKTDRVVL